MRALLADAFIVLGLAIVTIGVYGVVRLPDVYTQLHASGKAAFLGVVFLLLAAALEGDGAILTRVVLITVLLAVTTPVAAHVVGQAARARGEEMRTPGAIDETAPPSIRTRASQPPQAPAVVARPDAGKPLAGSHGGEASVTSS